MFFIKYLIHYQNLDLARRPLQSAQLQEGRQEEDALRSRLESESRLKSESVW